MLTKITKIKSIYKKNTHLKVKPINVLHIDILCYFNNFRINVIIEKLINNLPAEKGAREKETEQNLILNRQYSF